MHTMLALLFFSFSQSNYAPCWLTDQNILKMSKMHTKKNHLIVCLHTLTSFSFFLNNNNNKMQCKRSQILFLVTAILAPFYDNVITHKLTCCCYILFYLT